jgi:hypothetical protein
VSSITYGGETLATGLTVDYLTTRLIDFSPVETEDRQDVLFTKIVFDMAGIISAPIPPALLGETATTTLARLAHYFEQKRKAFQYSVGGQPLVTWAGGPDCANGPHPSGVKVRRVHGSEVYHIEFRIEVNICTCPQDPRQPWVAHRWTEDVTLDDTARTTKTRRGRITTRGDMRVSADEVRGLVVPPIDEGFTREESRYLLQSDGLALDYSYRDREQYVMPPGPAWKASGTYTESTPTAAQRFGEVRVTLRGNTQTDKDDLMRVAVSVAWSKLAGQVFFGDPKDMVIAIGALQEDLYEPEVSVVVRARLKPLTGRIGKVPVDLSRFNLFPFGSDPNKDRITPPDPGDRGTAGLELVAQVLNDPCLSQTIIKAGGSEPSDQSTLTGAPEIAGITQIRTTQRLPEDNQVKFRDDDPGIFTDYKVQIRTTQRLHRMQLPVGKEGAAPVIIQTAAPSQRRVAKWVAEKVGGPPKLPDPDMGDNYQLAHADILSREVIPDGDGESLRYRVSGRYVYFVKDFGTAKMTAGLPPWVDQSAKEDSSKAVSLFAKGILDPAGGFGAVFKADGSVATTTTLTTDGGNNLENG